MIYDENDVDIEDVLSNRNKKKKINCGRKGKRKEREIVEILNKRFEDILSKNNKWGRFSRSVGSGNRSGQNVFLSNVAKKIFGSDITTPEGGFKFSIESKGGYNDIDLILCFSDGNKKLNGFLKQVSKDARQTHRKPLLLWKKDRKPILAFIKIHDLKGFNLKPKCAMKYKSWIIISLDDLLSLPDNFFFKANYEK